MDATVHQHADYCQQLLLDCDDPIFRGPLFFGKAGQPRKKMLDLASKNSEDAVTWSVFRLLDRHFGDQPWLPGLLAAAGCDVSASGQPQVCFWEKGYPSQERLLWLLNNVDHPRVAGSQGARQNPKRLETVRQNLADYCQRVEKGKLGPYQWVLEGATEFDAVIRCPGLLVAVEAKLYSDVATGVRWDKQRDQIGRSIDAGLRLAGDGRFAFLLVTDRRRHPAPLSYEQLMARYRFNPPRGLTANELGWLTWGEIYHWLESSKADCSPEQLVWIEKLEKYLAERSLLAE